MELCKDTDGIVYKWVLDRLTPSEGHLQTPNHLTVAIRDNGVIHAGMIYSVIDEICWMTMYAPSSRWCNRTTISRLLDIGVSMGKIAKFATSHKNERVNKLLWGLGIHREGTLRYQRQNGQHEIVWSITAKELNKKRWYRCQVQ